MDRRKFLCGLGCAGMAAIAGCAGKGAAGEGSSGMVADRAGVRPEDLSYCGLDCSACDVYKATVHGNQEARMRAAEGWQETARKHWRMETLDPMVLDCRGCRAPGKKHQGYGQCPAERCAREKGVASCGLCPEWEECPFLVEILTNDPQARGNLQRIAERAGA
jgi:hypothetical protein